jgi:hypothetical protein
VVELKDVGDYVVLLLVVAGGGALGGLGATLVPTATPGLKSPRWLTGAINDKIERIREEERRKAERAIGKLLRPYPPDTYR